MDYHRIIQDMTIQECKPLCTQTSPKCIGHNWILSKKTIYTRVRCGRCAPSCRQCNSANLATCATEVKVHRTKDVKLCVDVHPRQGDKERLLPLVGKAAGQPLLVRYIFTMNASLCGTHKWCEGGPEFLSSGAILCLLDGCGTVDYGFP